jgi:hypothetical protein
MVTAGYLALEFEHPEKKVEQIKDFCVVMSSGDALVAFEIIEQLKKSATTLKTVSDIAEKLYRLLVDLSLKRAEQKFLTPRGLDWDIYRDRADRINPQLYMILDDYLTSFSLETDFLVVGLDETGGHIVSVDFPGSIAYLDKIGFGAVGSGITHATVSLCLDGQMRNRTLPDTLFALYTAKRKAESAPGVGAESDMGVISDRGICFLTSEHLKLLENAYSESAKKTNNLSELEKICDEIREKK